MMGSIHDNERNVRSDETGSEKEDSSPDEEEDRTMSNEITTKKETKDVLHLKLLVLSILVVSALTIASCVYVYITRSEKSQFESKFTNDADKVLEAIGSSLHRTLGLLDSLSVTLVSYARDQNETWPFVTLPDFGARLAKLLPLTDAVSVVMLPIIYPEKRKAWEDYSMKNDYWVNETIAIQEPWSGFHGPISYDWTPRGIFGDNGDLDANVSRFMLPYWQNFPVITTVVDPYNWDWRSIEAPAALDAAIAGRRSVMSHTFMIPNPNNPKIQAESEGWIDWFKGYVAPDENPFEPVVELHFPIVNDISLADQSIKETDSTGNDTQVVGLLAVSMYWRSLIRDILPPGSNGVLVVVECPCNEIFTYQINGAEVSFLGIGDAHNGKYRHLAKEIKLAELTENSARDTAYTGPPIDKDYCPYTIHLYPSELMQSDFQSNNAVIFMVSTICIFIFTSLVFYLYDWKVERRQHRVVSTAQRSSALLSNLFPATVRDQLYQTQGDSTNVRKRKWGLPVPFLDDSPSSDQMAVPGGASAIAQLYTDTSVIFMDIVGFTFWSSTRQPTEVFQLLETIYARFDALAKFHGVFKIETIGDSYVAVVGLPTKRKRHAVIMARFANDCRESMKEVMTQLNVILGQGTSDLNLRIGINSGPSTAGVLRGEKARFQLFGDTINTAARMESNGEANKIHVSEATAMLIESAGYGQWLIERPDKVMAKGKGLMQTYWCEPTSADGKSTVSSDDFDFTSEVCQL